MCAQDPLPGFPERPSPPSGDGPIREENVPPPERRNGTEASPPPLGPARTEEGRRPTDPSSLAELRRRQAVLTEAIEAHFRELGAR
ncbi:hypothetical protein [Streptomyces alkaliphilus]|uniref:hypothetical protein n=1 Tax=Streptomyces alkaliphilus TaxID=1472722 RepID=UPI00117FA03E|nr:hypothetical protein [Streptomyces alkaliphilus]MQS07513.1 hypothetical protein [Streptomyces alkaliphilus]